MGKYSVRGSIEFEEQVEEHLRIITKAVCALKGVVSIILMGGYGRGEGTAFQSGDIEKPFNDYDLIVVANSSIEKQLAQLEVKLSHNLGIEVDLYHHSLSSLRGAEYSLMNLELRYGHQVVYGPKDILNQMPLYHLDSLSLEEGTRLMLNRGKLLLDIKQELTSQPTEEQTIRFKKFLWKNYLAFGDCVLLLYKDYDISYRKKGSRIAHYLNRQEIPNSSWLVKRYEEAIEFKLSGNIGDLNIESIYHSLKETVHYYLSFFLWYEGRRLDSSFPDIQTYYAAIHPSLKKGKSFILNGYLLGVGMFKPSIKWSMIHPRYRLYIALYLLLSETDTDLLIRLLDSKQKDQILQRFSKIRRRVA